MYFIKLEPFLTYLSKLKLIYWYSKIICYNRNIIKVNWLRIKSLNKKEKGNIINGK